MLLIAENNDPHKGACPMCGTRFVASCEETAALIMFAELLASGRFVIVDETESPVLD